MQTTHQKPETGREASAHTNGCPFCGPTLAVGGPCCQGRVPYRSGYLSCTRLATHAGPCIACTTDRHCVAVSRAEVPS